MKNIIKRSRFTGYKGMKRVGQDADRRLAEMQMNMMNKMANAIADKPLTMNNPFIADNFFKQNPSKILGTQTMRKGRFGEIIHVEGNLSNINKIDASPVAVADIYPSAVPTAKTEQAVIEKVFETEEKEITEKQVKERRQKKPIVPAAKADSDGDAYTFAEIDELYNKNISGDEKEAYYFTHPELNYKLLFPEFFNSREMLVSKKLICWDVDEKKYVYVYTYQSGNIGKKISSLQRDKDKFVQTHGANQWQTQMDMLAAVRPKQKGLVGDERITILPHSNFAKGFKINELRYGKPELHGETDLFWAFKRWLYQLPADQFKKSNSREIIDYYLDNKSLGANPKDSKEQQAKDEKIAINIRQRTKEEGDELFARFLADELTPDDQAKLQFLWNEKFNSYAEPNLTKIPVCFRIGKKFKLGPLMLNPTQRQAAAFQTEKLSALLAYGVGVGKTLASIVCFSQAHYNGYAKKGVFVVPTNTYDKWLGEIQGYKDKNTGEFMNGALPQLPPIVGLFNLNPGIVYETLKDYTTKEQLHLDSIMNAIAFLKKIDAPEPKAGQKQEANKIYPINWPGVEAEYQFYKESTKSANPKSLSAFVIDYLKDEYNYYIYAAGKVKSFPDGTIFVTTEVGLQRLGISDANKDELSIKLYRILSQGELTGDKQSKRDVAKLQVKIDQTISSSMKNAKLLVEDLGLDWVCFDEAHYYKKIFTFVKGTITGEETKYDRTTQSYEKKLKRDKSKYELKSGSVPSSRALSAFVLSHFIQSKNNNRNVIQLTATPFTNSPLEVYSMLTLTNYKALEDMGMENMVDFFDTFMKINYDIKYTPQKTVVKDVVLTGYNNLPQLRQLIYSLMDKKDEGASLKRPVKIIMPSVEKGIETTLPMTQEQNELMAEVKKYIQGNTEYEVVCTSALQEELDNIDFDGLDDEALISNWEQVTQQDYEGERENLSDVKREQLIKRIKSQGEGGIQLGEHELDDEEKKGVRILKGLSMMRQITLSPYLFHKACNKAAGGPAIMPNYKDYVNSSPKFKYVMGCIKSTFDWHKKTNTKPGGHVIYMNAGVEYFPLLKQYLVKELGLKETQIGIVSGGMSKGAKENAKNRFLSGDILVLIGSSTISVGVDLQNNATTLYNCYYDWNPTDAAQIEGRIWRQGNRFAFVRIVYPQCYNSADPVIFEYLNSKTLRINEIWNRSSEVQELDLRDFNPKELQKKLITDPEEKADWEILEETDKISGEILFAENRRETLQNAMYAFRGVNETRPKVIRWLNELANKKMTTAKAEAVQAQKDKINEIVEKFGDDPDKMAAEISKYKKSRYDHEKDPDSKYVPMDYSQLGDEKVFVDAKKYIDMVDDWGYDDRDTWGELYQKRHDIGTDLKAFRLHYRDMKAAEERILKPMGLSFANADNPIVDFDKKIEDLKAQLTAIEETKPARVEHLRKLAAETSSTLKTVRDRIEEFAAMNDQYLAPQLVYTDTRAEQTVPVNKEEIIVPKAEEKLKAQGIGDKAKAKQPTNKATVVKIQHYDGQAKPWNKEKEYNVNADQIETETIGDEKFNWIGKQRVVLKSDWEKGQLVKSEAKVEKSATNKAAIEKQISGLKVAMKFADDKEKFQKQIKALEIAAKFAA